MSFLGRLITAILCVILIVLFPLQYMAQVTIESIDYMIEEKTNEFTDSIRELGYLDQSMYETYLSFLDTSNERYEISFEYIVPVYGEDMSSERGYGSQISTASRRYINSKIVKHESTKNQFLQISDSGHTHTDSCYEGHGHDEGHKDMELICDKVLSFVELESSLTEVQKYTSVYELPLVVKGTLLNGSTVRITSNITVLGYHSNIVGEQTVTIMVIYEGISYSLNETILVKGLEVICSRCQNLYYLNGDDSDPGCRYCIDTLLKIEVSPEYVEVTEGDSLPITVIASYFDGKQTSVTGWKSSYNPDQLGFQVILIEYGEFGTYITVKVNEQMQECVFCGTEYPLSEIQCPSCMVTVTHISLSSYDITLQQYEIIPLQVTAYYSDGTSKEVLDWSIDYGTDMVGAFTVNVSYSGAVASFQLTVISEWATECTFCGLTYEPQHNPRGCPVCSSTIVGIEAYLTTDSYKVQIGSFPSIEVVTIYQDEHREFVEGFEYSNYDAFTLGIQLILVKYQDHIDTIEVDVVNHVYMVTCNKGHMYYLDEDGNDLGCPFCVNSVRNDVIYYYDIVYWTDIVNEIYSRGQFVFQSGSYITMKVVKKEVSTLARMQRMFFRTSLLGRKQYFISGGEID